MQRMQDPITKLIELKPEERKLYISTLDEYETNHFLHLAKRQLALQENQFITLNPTKEKGNAEASALYGYEKTDLIGNIEFASYTGRISILKDPQLLDVISALQERKERNDIEWKQRITDKLFNTHQSAKNTEKDTKDSKDRLFTHLNNNPYLEDRNETTQHLRQAIEQINFLKLTISEKDKIIEKDNLLLSNLNKELAAYKTKNSELKKMLQGSHEIQKQIKIQELKDILKKYEAKKYKFFSHVPELLRNLNQLFDGRAFVTKAEVRSCLADPNHLFDSTPLYSKRDHLTNRGKLICELADAFNQQAISTLEMKAK